MPSGIPGFDEIADGGLPLGGVTVVLGGAGAGKTIFGMQVLATGARDRGEPGILVAFEESAERIVANVASFSWGGKAVAEHGVHVLDAQLPQAVEQGGEFDLLGLLALVAAKAKNVGARRVVFDGLDVLLGYLLDPGLVRREVLRLRDWVHQSGLNAIVTAKADAAEARAATEYDFLQFMADCVVTLHHRVHDSTALRFIRVAKYRGAAHSANEIPMTITGGGLEVAGNTPIEMVHPASDERISTGVARLDVMLSGGFHRGSSVLITGAPGSAKTSLAAAFTVAAVLRGERTVYVSFDEAPAQIVRNVASIGIDLRPHLAAGTLKIQSLRARSESPEAHVARIRGFLREERPQNLVVDPLSALRNRSREADAEDAALQLIDHAKALGITLFCTSLLGNPLPLSEQTPLGVSTIADTWMHVSYVNQGGERNRALTIIKARGTSHSNQVRELVLSDAGVTLADVYTVGGEVLMGTLRWEKENEARRSQATSRSIGRLREQKAELALAQTRSRAETLGKEAAIQLAELQHIRTEVEADHVHRAREVGELLERRGADSELPAPSDEPGGASSVAS
jgi:circadian clock protein KaiC